MPVKVLLDGLTLGRVRHHGDLVPATEVPLNVLHRIRRGDHPHAEWVKPAKDMAAALVAEPDDFTAIEGIDEALAERLWQVGVRSYAELAACNADWLAAGFPGVSSDQMRRWQAEAQKLQQPR